MHSFLTRANALFAFSLTLLGALAAGLYFTSLFYSQNGSVALQTNKIFVKSMTDFGVGKKKNDLGFFNFDLNTDLTPLFNWNVKMLFLYLTAEYETKNNKINQVVVWDKIVKKHENYKLAYSGAKTKYYFWDDGDGLRGNNNITLYLTWNVIPNVGYLPNVPVDGKHTFGFNSQYSSSV